MQQRIADLPPVSGLKLTIRIGLHCGEVSMEGGKPTGPPIASAARIAGIARRDQILCSSRLYDELPHPGVIVGDPMPKLGAVQEGDTSLSLFQITWTSYHNNGTYSQLSAFGPSSNIPAERLCVRYRGKAFLLDEKTPVLTIGRDLGCKLLILDRKEVFADDRTWCFWDQDGVSARRGRAAAEYVKMSGVRGGHAREATPESPCC